MKTLTLLIFLLINFACTNSKSTAKNKNSSIPWNQPVNHSKGMGIAY